MQRNRDLPLMTSPRSAGQSTVCSPAGQAGARYPSISWGSTCPAKVPWSHARRHAIPRAMHSRSASERDRTREVRELRNRLRRFAAAGAASGEEVRAALEMRSLREQVVQILGDVEACRICATGHPLPHGRWDGGYCCGTKTEYLFWDDEVAALGLSGARGWHLKLLSGEAAGCAFRHPTGCALAWWHRPVVCTRYTCQALRHELDGRGVLEDYEEVSDRLLAAFRRFAAARASRLADEERK